jgi:hypothetical protein
LGGLPPKPRSPIRKKTRSDRDEVHGQTATAVILVKLVKLGKAFFPGLASFADLRIMGRT